MKNRATINSESTTEPQPQKGQQLPKGFGGALLYFTGQIFTLDVAVVKHKNAGFLTYTGSNLINN